MIRTYNSVSFTNDDLNGFLFREYKDNELNKRLIFHFSFVVFSIITMILLFPLLKLYSFLVLFFTIFHICKIIYYKINCKTLYASVQIVEKLPIESIEITLSSECMNFYPVNCMDVETGYESICYVPIDTYNNCNVGDTIKIFDYTNSYRCVVNRDSYNLEMD